jgi:hypothetical protein
MEQLLETGSEGSAWIQQFAKNLGNNFHEAYHFWQGLRLPFLHRYALLTLRTTAHAFQKLDTIENLHEWHCLLPEFERLFLPSRWHSPMPGQVNVAPLSQGKGPGIDLTPSDLFEGAASLAQWQTTVAQGSERWSWIHFKRWSKRNPSYTTAIDAVANALGDDSLALRCFLPMVNVAFHTSEPVLSLGHLTCILSMPEIASWKHHPEPCRWRELFTKSLALIPFKATPNYDDNIIGSPYHQITESWLETRPEHPMLASLATKWLKFEQNDHRYIMLLDQPGYLDGNFVAEVMRDFAPFTLTCFHLQNGRNRIVTTASGDTDESNALLHGYFWLRTLTLYSVVRRAADAHCDPETRLCYHSECPEYKPNYCNAYPLIPDSFQDCKFREVVSQLRSEMKEFINVKHK